MRLIKRSPLRRLLGHLRFAFARLFHFRRMRAPWLGLVDAGCSIFVVGKNARIKIGNKFTLGRGSELQSRGVLEMGDRVFINRNSRIVSFEKVTIGNDCLLAAGVTILDHDHQPEFVEGRPVRNTYITAEVKIGTCVWIGEKVTVLKGVSIGENSVIAAHAVVTRDVPPNCIAGGIPAQVIKELAN